jgi:calcineurin-like phosphoesterase family protein
MDLALMENWNCAVKKDDIVYVLGDFAWKNAGMYADRLHGRKILIIGSHDKRKQCEGHFSEIHDFGVEIKIDGQHITLCHYCLRTWPRSHYGSWHLYGHSHGNLPPIGLSMDVGVDCNAYAPVSWERVKEVMRNKLVPG